MRKNIVEYNRITGSLSPVMGGLVCRACMEVGMRLENKSVIVQKSVCTRSHNDYHILCFPNSYHAAKLHTNKPRPSPPHYTEHNIIIQFNTTEDMNNLKCSLMKKSVLPLSCVPVFNYVKSYIFNPVIKIKTFFKVVIISSYYGII